MLDNDNNFYKQKKKLTANLIIPKPTIFKEFLGIL